MPNLFIKSDGRTYNAHWPELYKLLGVEGSHLPVDGIPPVVIQGITVWVNAQDPHRTSTRHRVKASCPVCHKVVSAGRLHQHAKIHKDI